jgi:YHS domain-containing protein
MSRWVIVFACIAALSFLSACEGPEEEDGVAAQPEEAVEELQTADEEVAEAADEEADAAEPVMEEEAAATETEAVVDDAAGMDHEHDAMAAAEEDAEDVELVIAEFATPVDVICDMSLEEHGVAATFEHEGETYGFCSEYCRDKFQEDPEAALAKHAARQENEEDA